MPVLSPTITVQDGFGSCRRVPSWSTATSRLATACSPRLHSSALLATATASTAATSWRRLFSGPLSVKKLPCYNNRDTVLDSSPAIHFIASFRSKNTSAHHPNNSQIKMLKPSAAHCWSSVWFPLISLQPLKEPRSYHNMSFSQIQP